MHSLTVRLLAAALLCAVPALTAAAQEGRPSPAAEKIAKLRAALNQKVTLDFSSNQLEDGIEHLRQKTKLPITVDPLSMQMLGIGVVPGGVPNGNPPTPIHLKVDNGPVRVGLQRMLSPYNLTYILLNDSVHIIAEQFAHHKQMSQRVGVDVGGKSLAVALKDLASETGVTFIFDPRVAKEAEGKVELKLEDATLETAARLLAEVGGLKVVPVGNVLFVTDATKAEQIRKENLDNQRQNNQFSPPVTYALPAFGRAGGGFALPAPPLKVAPPVPPAKDAPPRPR
jgi:type II secretory pathway component GspD/PulD (secretin)